jgi:hypothetical protein
MASFILMCWNVENLFLPEEDNSEQVHAPRPGGRAG